MINIIMFEITAHTVLYIYNVNMHMSAIFNMYSVLN